MISGLPLNVALRRLRWYGKLLPLLKFTGGRDSRELYYQGILSQSLVALQVTTPPLYPVSSGANFSLFYCLSRAIIDLEVKSVLELGAGQTSLLLNSIKRCRPDLRVRTVETDEGWCKRISVVDRWFQSRLTAYAAVSGFR